MIENIYSTWLTAIPSFYIGMGIFSLCTIIPKSDSYTNYNISRKCFGVLTILMGLYIAALGIFDFRTNNLVLASAINSISFFAAANISSVTFRSLLNDNYFTWEIARKIIIKCSVFSALVIANVLFVPENMHNITTPIIILMLLVELILVAYNFFKAYIKKKNEIENYYSENFEPLMKWMRNSLYLLIAIGVFGSAHSFYPSWVNLIYGIVSSLAFTYALISFHNYMVTLNEVHLAFSSNNSNVYTGKQTFHNQELSAKVNKWITSKGFIKPGITLAELAKDIDSENPDVIAYIRDTYNLTYRDWIGMLRVEYSKEILTNNPELKLSVVASMVGYSHTSFITAFTKFCGISPSAWLCGVSKVRVS